MTTAAESLINAFLPIAERAVTALERWLDDARIGIVDDEPEHAVPITVTINSPVELSADETIRRAQEATTP